MLRRILLTLAIVAPQACFSQSATFAAVLSDHIDFLDVNGNRLRSIRADLRQLHSFTFSGTANFATAIAGKCGDELEGVLKELDLTNGIQKTISIRGLLPGPLERGERAVAAEPAMSPDGQFIAFIVRPCRDSSHLDAVEAAGVVAIYNRKTERTRVLKVSLNASGFPEAFANTPSWSADSKLLYFNFEVGFRVVHVESGEVVESRAANWNAAIGWAGSSCVVYQEGDDYKEAAQHPAKALQITRQITTEMPNTSFPGRVLDLRWPFAILEIGDKHLREI